MRVPLSWLKDFIDINIGAEELAERLTLAGLEVKTIEYIGVPQGEAPAGITVPPSDHLVWDRDKIILGAITEVKPHPNADKLVLAMVDIGGGKIEQVVTGAPNLYPYKGQGVLNPPLLSPVALEGAEVYDGHAAGQQRMVLKEKALRGIPNKHMVCSAKELGIAEDHDGIMLLEDISAPVGTPLVDVLGDVIFEIDLTPNLARAYGIIGVAREAAALTGQSLKEPSYAVKQTGSSVEQAVKIEITNADLNPRFTAMLIRDIEIKPSPQWLQRRLLAVGERPINNIVDVTNYIMFESGQPLHAFDYDVLVQRAGGKTPTIITRTPKAGETLQTLDGEVRKLDDQMILVCDTAGILSLGGIMGGEESKVQPTTRNILLEAASWNYINIRRTMTILKMSSEAGLRFSRGVHPAQAERGLRRAIELMRQLGGDQATVAQGIIDVYPKPAPQIHIDLPISEIKRIVGIEIDAETAAGILRRLQFTVTVAGDLLHVDVPDHRMDISSGDVGIADLCEEVARIYGYDRVPDTLIEDMLPPQANNDEISREEDVRDLLSQAGMREVVNYRLTTPEAEARLNAPGTSSSWSGDGYVTLANPIAADKTSMRHTLLNGVIENIAANSRHTSRQLLFEIGSVYLPVKGHKLPDEPRRLALALTGARTIFSWQDGMAAQKNPPLMDFFDLKGILDALAHGLRVGALTYKAEEHSSFHPGRCAGVYRNGKRVGTIGELHPLVREAYDLEQPVIATELDFDLLVSDIPLVDSIKAIPTQPAVYQDIALVLADNISAADVEQVIVKAGGNLLYDVRLFDVYRGEPIPAGKKSLAYALTYLAPDRTLTDSEVAKVQQRIVKAAEQQLGATLRS
ncbi:MAG: phenylalanine--tRNA ligase subunit beta [Anaerolineae bacterium]|nr:phenylalanine--tRNA ligase subunit beta [Anaerolineae bacterium]